MHYQQLYDRLISKRLKEPATGYTEKHHIVPKSLGGSDDPSNLVVLSAREHWVAHLLLYKINPCSQTVHACNMMARKSKYNERKGICNSRMYKVIREEHAKYAAKNGKQRIGNKNGAYGTRWVCNIELQENKRISKNELIPDGWVAGRNKWKHVKRIRLNSGIGITNGIKNKILYWEDQLPIPNGWYEGYTFSESHKQKVKKAIAEVGRNNKNHKRNSGQSNPMSSINRAKREVGSRGIS